jgi:hypothetical protein
VAIGSLWDIVASDPVQGIGAVDVDVCDLLLQACQTNAPTPAVRIVAVAVAVDGYFRGTRCDVAVCLLWVSLGGRVTVDRLFFALPVFELARVLSILF